MNEIYEVNHSLKGTFKGRVIHRGKLAIYIEIVELGTIPEILGIQVGEDVRISSGRNCTLKKLPINSIV